MADEKQNPWDLASGLPLEGATVTIGDNSLFTINNEYAAGAVVASFELIPDVYDGDRETLRPQMYSVGKGWEPVAKGKELAHESGKFRKISASSRYGTWIARAMACDGAEAYLLAQDPRLMATWIGTRWTLGAETATTLEKKEKTILVPVAFHGTKAGGERKGSKAAASATKKAAETLPDLDGDLMKALIECAQANDDYDAFMAKAYEIPGVEGDADAERVVMSKKHYATLRNA